MISAQEMNRADVNYNSVVLSILLQNNDLLGDARSDQHQASGWVTCFPQSG